ncbi:MAG TPA: cache domain-containing protein, partial [Rhodopila sp.]|nr:cache domain-containing protein [Rhodopila sp.]
MSGRPPSQHAGLRGGTASLVVCVCIALIGTEAWQSHQVYQDNIARNQVVTLNTARSMAEQAETTLVTADTIVASLVERVEAEGTGTEARTRLYHLMTSLAAALPAIHEMGIMDSHGNAIVKSLVAHPEGMNYAEREYFRYHATHPDRGPLLGERIKSKVDGTINVTITRRINNADGSFGGVVVTSVALNFFQHLFDQVQAKSGGIISLFGDDGTFLVRSPPVPFEAAGRAIAGSGELRPQLHRLPEFGLVTYTSALDGVRRSGAYSHLSGFPLTVLVAQSDWDIQSSWRTDLRS